MRIGYAVIFLFGNKTLPLCPLFVDVDKVKINIEQYQTDMKKNVVAMMAICMYAGTVSAQTPPVLPPAEELHAPFGDNDRKNFFEPPPVYRPETWFHFIGGNVSKKGITADLEAIAAAGISGIQLFHGQFGGQWLGTTEQIACLSEKWDDAVKHTAKECRRLGLRFTMQNCPGWAMSGGPWIEPANAMRHLTLSRTDVDGGTAIDISLPAPQTGGEEWRDYRDVAVITFPTPLDDTGQPLRPQSVRGEPDVAWSEFMSGQPNKSVQLKPVADGKPHWIEVTFPAPVMLRTIELSSINGFNHGWCYEPDVTVTALAVHSDGRAEEILYADIPQASWQDDQPLSLACSETSKDASVYKIHISNRHDMHLGFIRLYSAARKNNWESEAGWTLRSIERRAAHPKQSSAAFIKHSQIVDISASMDGDGRLRHTFPAGKWTVLRIGHVNTGQKNGPAPPEGTGWECNKLSESGANAQFAGYIGRLAGQNGALSDGLLNGMLMDSWECKTQTWTDGMEDEFARIASYPLRRWLPAVFGYVIDSQDTTARFLRDWRAVTGDLFSNRFYGRMAQLAHENGLAVSYETAAGDIFPADVMEYYKHADVPMCEFWHPISDHYVGSLNFKPIKPTASAARIYGKPRVAAEAFTSFNLTWDEHWSMLRDVANRNSIEGVTHLVFHTYTHNPQTGFLPPGTSFGAGIGTPFLRGQTWWKQMPEFTSCLSRCGYLLERGQPVSDVLWYLGDEINHKPDQNTPFPVGFKYDYCNHDALLNRLTVRNGRLVTPEGISYRLLWLTDNVRMLPQTLEKLLSLVRDGATVVGNAPLGMATLSGGDAAQQRFDSSVRELWGDSRRRRIQQIGAGLVMSGMSIDDALRELLIEPDVTGGDAMWLHRRTEGADWYFVCAPTGSSFDGALSFRQTGNVEIWDPVSGNVFPSEAKTENWRTTVPLHLPYAGSCFVVFRHNGKHENAAVGRTADNRATRIIPMKNAWKLTFPKGWGTPASLRIDTLKAWKDLDVSPEARTFSGTVKYTTTFDAGKIKSGENITLDLGRVEMIAVVKLNGKLLRTLWTPPYSLDLTGAVKSGKNRLTVEVTGTWFNRLVYDAGLPESDRKTWTISAPPKDSPLRDSGLLGPVVVSVTTR